MRTSPSLPQGPPLLASLLAVLLVFPPAVGFAAQAPGFAEIITPAPGESLSGMVTIAGSANHPAFVSYELAFAYANDNTGTWFPIAEAVTTPVTDGPLALWDTRSLSDEVYVLRLLVLLGDGSLLETTVGDLRVSNYTPTRIPPADQAASPAPTLTPVNAPPTPELDAPPPTAPPAEQIVLTALRLGMAAGAASLLAVGLIVVGRRAWRWGQASIPRRRPRRRRRRRNAR